MATPPSPPPAVIFSSIIFFLGGWDLAICGDLILQGIIFAQIAHYTTLYEKDVLALRAFVAVLLIITTLKSAQGLVILWIQNVENFMNLEAAIGMFTGSWTTEINPTFSALIAFYVQLYFCRRLWGISRNVYIVASVLALFVFALVAAIVSGVLTFADQVKNVTWGKEAVETLGCVLTGSSLVEIHLGTVFAGDVLLCGSTIYFLLYHSEYASPQTAGMLHSIKKLTFQSAAPAVVCALISLVSTISWDRATPNAYILLAIIASNVLPKLYAISAMWTLNSRMSIRQAHSSTGRRGSGATLSFASRPRRTNDIELSPPWVASSQSVVVNVQQEVETKDYTEPAFLPKHDRPYPKTLQDELYQKILCGEVGGGPPRKRATVEKVEEEGVNPRRGSGSGHGSSGTKTGKTRNPIYLFNETVDKGTDQAAVSPGDRHFKCYHGNPKFLTINRAMKYSLDVQVFKPI
ncbi:hypothetical protein C8J57DRAFT_1478303 [Mycena rebaudengoi]|nr:hypothetical protein C8J57DRAFT_1478303 [Mycena rebaudengoi]